jgi:hypothetical protein
MSSGPFLTPNWTPNFNAAYAPKPCPKQPATPLPLMQQPQFGNLPWAQQPQIAPLMGQPGQPAVTPAGTPAPWQSAMKGMGDTVKSELQKAFPGNYAHLIKWQPVQGTVRNAKQTAHMMDEVANHRPVKDHELITFDDNLKRGASLGIATLATLGLNQRIFGVGEYLGFLSWFSAMAATPALINTMVRLKTSVNLNQSYDSTYGQRLNLYKDPNYLPLHILSDKQIEQAADKLHIPHGPNRRRETEDKMRQVSVQAHTWWMLAAGPATPVLSGLACDLLQDPATRAVNAVKRKAAQMETWRIFHQTENSGDAVARKAKVYLEQVVGDLPESELSSWWKQFGQGLVKHAGLTQAMDVKDIRHGARTTQLDKLVTYLAGLADSQNPKLQKTLDFLDRQYLREEIKGKDCISGKLPNLGQKAEKYLEEFKSEPQKGLYQEDFEALERHVETRISNAQSTVTHYRNLFESIKNYVPKVGEATLEERIRARLSEPNINTVQDLLTHGKWKKAQELVGDEDTFKAISGALKNNKREFNRAFSLMGAAPEKHLLDNALKSVMLGNMWRTRVGLYLGGGLLAATGLYNFLMVGRDFQPPAKKPPGGLT